MKNSVKITKEQLIEMLKNWNFGSQPASIAYITNPKLNAEGTKKFGQITKVALVGGMIGYSYENAVNNQLEREQKEREFLAQSLWNGKGKRINNALSTHIEKNTFYLTYKAQQTFKSYYFDSALTLIAYNMIKMFFPPNKPTNQGTETAVYHREISIDNIRKLKFKKMTYIISQ